MGYKLRTIATASVQLGKNRPVWSRLVPFGPVSVSRDIRDG